MKKKTQKTKVEFLRIDKALGLSGLELAVRVLGALLLSVVIPLMTKDISPLDQVFLGALVFVVVSMTGMTVDLLRFRQHQLKQIDLGYLQMEFDVKLANIRKAYYDLLSRRRGEEDLYTTYFERMISEFEETIHTAATQDDLLVDENHFSTTDSLLACFDGRPSDILRFVHFLRDNDWMLDEWSHAYYERVVALVEAGTVKEVRRLFIYSNTAELETDESKRLLDFHERHPGYDYRTLPEGVFQKFCNDLVINRNYGDFGVYGDMYVYRTVSAKPEQIEGVFSCSSRLVEKYMELFDRCWERGLAPAPTDKEPMTVHELFYGEPPPPYLQSRPSGTSILRTIGGGHGKSQGTN